MPRLKPPFPANVGLYGCPTTVNNVEIDRRRADHPAPRRRLVRRHRPAEQHRHQAVLHLRPCEQAVHRRRGDGHSAEGADRAACRRRARRLGQPAGGDPGRRVGAAAAEVDLRHRPDGFRRAAQAKSGLGTAAVIVMDKSTDVVKAIARLSRLLQARKLRPVHAVPRRHRLDVAGDGAHGAGQRAASRRSTCSTT